MKSLFRLAAIAVFVAIVGCCVFGFVATFEPMPSRDRVIWRTVYSLVGLATTIGLFRLLRCQCRRWFKRGVNRSLLLATLLPLALTACVNPRISNKHYFDIEAGTARLSDERAISIAKQTMEREGYDLMKWQLRRSDLNSSQWVGRYAGNANDARVLFTDGKQTRQVQVQLEGDRAVGRFFFGN